MFQISDIQHHDMYISYAKAIFARDNYTCKICGNQNKNNRVVFRKKSISLIVKENNITSYKDAMDCEELWDLNNGVTMCKLCRKKLEGR